MNFLHLSITIYIEKNEIIKQYDKLNSLVQHCNLMLEMEINSCRN